MPCVTCNHTMQCLGEDKGVRRFWCSRCGTLKDEVPSRRDQDHGLPIHESWETPRWIRLLLAGEWHQVQAELLDNRRLRDALEELKRTSPVEIK